MFLIFKDTEVLAARRTLLTPHVFLSLLFFDLACPGYGLTFLTDVPFPYSPHSERLGQGQGKYVCGECKWGHKINFRMLLCSYQIFSP